MKLDPAAFWQRTNKLIKSQKTKQEVVASACGISYQTFRGWVTRKAYPGGEEIFRIATALGTTVEYLVSGTKPEANRQYRDALEQIRDIASKSL